MEYVKGKPYFSDVKDKTKGFSYLDKNIECDYLIVGGGIDGAITAYYFAQNNFDAVLIEKHRLGYMNTSCATAILEYQLDMHANDLTAYFKKEEIVKIYYLGLKALDDIDKIIKQLGNFCHYSKRDTLIFTTKKSEVKELEREARFRQNNNLNIEFVDEKNNPFPFFLRAGIIAKNGGAEFNPYLFEKQLIENVDKKIRIFEHTEATEIIKLKDSYKLITNYGIEIKFKKIICTTGYNTALFTKKELCTKFVSYTITSEKLKDKLWQNCELLQDNSTPYHYMRLSDDNRLIIGGEDTLLKGDKIKGKKAEKKYKKLKKYAQNMFPELEMTNFEYEFCGLFSSTSNNLSIVGTLEEDDGIFYNLGYGANGILYSVYGAQNIVKLLKKEAFDDCLKFFLPNRQLL